MAVLDCHLDSIIITLLITCRRMCGDESTVTSVSFTPDSCYLATGSSGGEVRVWDARYGHSVPLAMKAEAHDLGVSSLHFSPAVGKEGKSGGKFRLFLEIILNPFTPLEDKRFVNDKSYGQWIIIYVQLH